MTAKTHTLTVRRTSTGFDVDFAQAPDAARVQELFGTTRIAAPFTPAAAPLDVVNAIAAKNPEARVVFAFPVNDVPRGWRIVSTSTDQN